MGAQSKHSQDTHCAVTGRPYGAEALKILAKRKTLPCWARKDEFLDIIRKNQVMVLVGETGSGKTTQMPQFLAEEFCKISKEGGKAGVCAITQPRRVAAMSVAARVAQEMDVELGQEVGYLIRFEDVTSEKTVVKYMTDGMLLRECMTDPMMAKYSVICLDEAHERTLSTDILFGLLKEVLKRRPDLKVVVMSATLEAEKFCKYFNNCPLMTVSGRMFPVETFWALQSSKNYVQDCIDTVVNIHRTEKEGDVLVFLTGEEEIMNACNESSHSFHSILPTHPGIQEIIDNSSDQGTINVMPLYSSLPPAQQRQVFDPSQPGIRKVVIATNIAETSITIDGVVYVVDPGLSKTKVYNPRSHMESLLVSPISRAAATQRTGRAGRTRNGKCFRLYTEDAFEKTLIQANMPEILRTNIATALLTLLNLGVKNVVQFPWMDPPSPESMQRAMETLLQLEAVDENFELTEDGKKLAEFPLEPTLGKLLIAGAEMGVATQMASVVAMLNVPPAHMRPRQFAKQADRAHRTFECSHGDHTTLLNIFDQYMAVPRAEQKKWCYDNYLKDRSLASAFSIRRQLTRMMEKQKLTVSTGTTKEIMDATEGMESDMKTCVRKALIAGFFPQTAFCQGKHFITEQDMKPVTIHPGSCLKHKPEWILYHELVLTKESYVRNVSAIRPEWLIEMVPQHFPGNVRNEDMVRSLKRAKERFERELRSKGLIGGA